MATIYGLDFEEFDRGELAMGAVLITKYMDDSTGEASYWYQSADVARAEAIGMAMLYIDHERSVPAHADD